MDTIILAAAAAAAAAAAMSADRWAWRWTMGGSQRNVHPRSNTLGLARSMAVIGLQLRCRLLCMLCTIQLLTGAVMGHVGVAGVTIGPAKAAGLAFIAIATLGLCGT